MINQVNDRMFSNPDDSQAKTLLNALLEEGVSADSYRKTMFKIGQHLGQKLAQSQVKNIVLPPLSKTRTFSLKIPSEMEIQLYRG
ncbi:hypothetical protein [Oceanospirillum maris]|uniref:hypothetical protein n=1 Tax=Oceanospirillum maris TaxID=64977 RepID=UPI000484CCE0|nr:hypothetical protein [Oceanospirillum maris]